MWLVFWDSVLPCFTVCPAGVCLQNSGSGKVPVNWANVLSKPQGNGMYKYQYYISYLSLLNSDCEHTWSISHLLSILKAILVAFRGMRCGDHLKALWWLNEDFQI